MAEGKKPVSVIRSILLDVTRTALRAWWGVAAAALLSLGVAMPAHASFCSATACTQTLDVSNGGGSGNFGSVKMTLSGDTVTVDVKLASGFKIIQTGFPGAFGFEDNLGGNLTIGNFSSSNYSGGTSLTVTGVSSCHPKPCTNDFHFDGFGYSNNAAATTAPSAGSVNAVQEVSFDVTGTGLNDVRDLLNLFSPAGAVPAYFVVDAFDGNGSCGAVFSGGCTGLLAISKVPEPGSLVLLGTGLLALGVLRRRKLI